MILFSSIRPKLLRASAGFLIAQFTISLRAAEQRYKIWDSRYNFLYAAMTKPPEEGRIWEWRAFGHLSETLAAKVRAYPVRFSDLRGDDIYLISPHSDQNV